MLGDLFKKSKFSKSKLERIAKENGFNKIKTDTFKRDDDYFLNYRNNPTYLMDFEDEEFKKVRKALDVKCGSSFPKTLGYSVAYPGSILGGGLLGYYLISLGFPQITLLIAIGAPTVTSLFNIVRSSMSENKKLSDAEKTIEEYEDRIFCGEDAVDSI